MYRTVVLYHTVTYTDHASFLPESLAFNCSWFEVLALRFCKTGLVMMFIFIDKVIIGLFWNIYFAAIHPSANERTKFGLDTDTQGMERIINRYGGSRSLYLLYKHYKKLIEILVQCHQYFLPLFQVIILDIMMSCDFKNFHILTFVNFVLPAAWSWFEYFIFTTCL